jgi:hypothetical protein
MYALQYNLFFNFVLVIMSYDKKIIVVLRNVGRKKIVLRSV